MGLSYALLGTTEMIISVVFDVAISMVMLRFLLQWVKVDFYNPICQGIIRLTNPALVPLRRVIPGLWGLDLAAVALMVVMKALQLILLSIVSGYGLRLSAFVLIPISLLQLAISVMFFSIIARAILSWVTPSFDQPLPELLVKLTEPLLAPVRERLPDLSGIDLSPIVVLIALQILSGFLHLWLGV